jgi:hypothetical protein
MSLLADTTSMLPGCLVASIYPGLGAPAAAIIAASSGGESGAGPLVGLGLVDGTDYYWTITSLPASGSLVIYEDGSFSHTGAADGSWPWSANVYADGVLQWTLTITDGVGVISGGVLGGSVVLGNVAPAGSMRSGVAARAYPLAGVVQEYPLAGVTQP